MTTLISLVGEQPIPILLPARFLQPDDVILIHTGLTEAVANRLANILQNATLHKLKARTYDLQGVFEEVRGLIKNKDTIINLTGGTKIMSLACYDAARLVSIPFVYLESERKKSLLYRYGFNGNLVVPIDIDNQPVELTDSINLDEYLRAHLPGYRQEGYHKDERGQLDNGGFFEKAVGECLKRHGFEVMAGVRPEGVKEQIEIDLVFRLNNQAGIAEIKLGDKKGDSGKRGLDQLAMAGGREYLGTYTSRFLISARRQPPAIQSLAQARNITVIHVNYDEDRHMIHPSFGLQLANNIKEKLTGTSSS